MDLPSSSDAAVSHGASESSSGISSVMDKSGSAVRVGVRVRPFSAKEISASGSSESVLTCSRDRTQEIRLGSRRFTYDAVFDQRVSQESLYQSVAGPLMENFLEGYNATVRRNSMIILESLSIYLFFALDFAFLTMPFASTDYGIWSDRVRKDLHNG